MIFMPFDHEELAALIAVVKTGSFRGAAENLKRAQSSISYAVKNLEKNLGIEVFNRDSYRPQLTEQGELIYQKAIHILKMQDDLINYASMIKAGQQTTLNLEVARLYPGTVLSNVIAQFQNKFPKVTINLKVNTGIIDLNSLLDNSCDLIISSALEEQTGLDRKLVTTIEELAVCHNSHPAAQEGLNDECFSNLTELKINTNDASGNIWEVADYELMKKFLLKGLAWGYIPRGIVISEISSNSLVNVANHNSRHTPIYMYRSQSQTLNKATDYLWQLFIKEAN